MARRATCSGVAALQEGSTRAGLDRPVLLLLVLEPRCRWRGRPLLVVVDMMSKKILWDGILLKRGGLRAAPAQNPRSLPHFGAPKLPATDDGGLLLSGAVAAAAGIIVLTTSWTREAS